MTSDAWKVDETYVKIKGVWHYLYRAIKYLNNSMENDHKSTKLKSRYRQWYQSFSTERNTLDGIETMRMIQKTPSSIR